MDVGEYIKTLRIKYGYSQEQLGAMVGVKRAAVQKWESGTVKNLKRETIKKLGEIFNVSPSSFIDDFSDTSLPGVMPLPRFVKKPRLGVISCGEPISTEENFDGYDDVPENVNCDFTLKCEGDSMIGARIHDGDIVYIKQQSTAEYGQIAAVLVDGCETLLKKIYINDDNVVLQAANPEYPPITFYKEDMNRVSVIGVAVGFYSRIR